MRLLLDTHTLIWALEDGDALRPEARREIVNARNEVFVSVVVFWEIIIKKTSGKLAVPPNLREVVSENRFEVLPILLDHVLALGALPPHHRDPFDRMLVAQAAVEGLTLVTSDRDLRNYGIPILLAG